jgi:hypothetical protein
MDLGYTVTTPVTAGGVQAAMPAGSGYCGMVANAAAAATVEIRDGSATGTLIDVLLMAAAGAYTTFFGPAPLYVNGKIFVNVVSGTLPASMSIRWR